MGESHRATAARATIASLLFVGETILLDGCSVVVVVGAAMGGSVSESVGASGASVALTGGVEDGSAVGSTVAEDGACAGAVVIVGLDAGCSVVVVGGEAGDGASVVEGGGVGAHVSVPARVGATVSVGGGVDDGDSPSPPPLRRQAVQFPNTTKVTVLPPSPWSRKQV